MNANKRIHDEVVSYIFDAAAQNALASATADVRMRLVGQILAPGQRILDIGCSYGLGMMYLRSIGHDVAGFEIAPGFVKICRERGLSVHEVDIENDPIPTGLGVFDAILCMEILEHLTDPLIVLKEKVRPLLKPGGRLIITVPNGAYIKDRLALLFGRAPGFGSGVPRGTRPYNLDHKTVFTVRGLAETVRLAGFRMGTMRVTPGYTPGLVLKARATPVWTRLAQSMPGLFARDIMCDAHLLSE